VLEFLLAIVGSLGVVVIIAFIAIMAMNLEDL
jgi:hypothetical protein